MEIDTLSFLLDFYRNKVFLGNSPLLMLMNPNKYGIDGDNEVHLTAQGRINGDVTGNANGLTADDALTIQKFLLKLINKLPE